MDGEWKMYWKGDYKNNDQLKNTDIESETKGNAPCARVPPRHN